MQTSAPLIGELVPDNDILSRILIIIPASRRPKDSLGLERLASSCILIPQSEIIMQLKQLEYSYSRELPNYDE